MAITITQFKAGTSRKTTRPRPIRVEGDIAYVPLGKRGALEAIIDAADVALVGQYNWSRTFGKWTPYAMFQRKVGEDRFMVRMHSLLYDDPDILVDHRDRNGLNNRRSNLRICPTAAHNNANSSLAKNNKSGFRGVTKSACPRKIWAAWLHVSGRGIYLGSFETKEEAARAYDTAAVLHFGEFAYRNFPEGT